jgi:hypothetical protein
MGAPIELFVGIIADDFLYHYRRQIVQPALAERAASQTSCGIK